MNDARQQTVLCCIGTRPEAIKMAPIIKALQAEPLIRCRVLVTAQHRDLLDQMLGFFGIVPDIDLNIMHPNQSLADLTARLISQLDAALAAEKPDMVLAQGDTTTVFCAALACFYRRVPFAHVEAGLRTGDFFSPFPEEANRCLTTRMAALHFAPTAGARENLLREGVDPDAIHVVGNPVIDALMCARARHVPLDVPLDPKCRMILVTAHRRESFGAPIRRICVALAALVDLFDDIEILWPVHPNPAVKSLVESLLGHTRRVHLCPPLEYGRFVTAIGACHLILTDSGGVQEEAPALGKPVLVMRENSDRPEAVRAGVARLVGTDTIVAQASRLLEDPQAHAAMTCGGSPYGDGHAAERIVAAIKGASNANRINAPDENGQAHSTRSVRTPEVFA